MYLFLYDERKEDEKITKKQKSTLFIKFLFLFYFQKNRKIEYYFIYCFGTGRQATMLKKLKGKMKRRNTEPTMQVATTGGPAMSLAVAPQENEENDTNNTDF